MRFGSAMALAMVPAQMIASTGGAREAQFTLLPAPPIAAHIGTSSRSPLPAHCLSTFLIPCTAWRVRFSFSTSAKRT